METKNTVVEENTSNTNLFQSYGDILYRVWNQKSQMTVIERKPLVDLIKILNEVQTESVVNYIFSLFGQHSSFGVAAGSHVILTDNGPKIFSSPDNAKAVSGGSARIDENSVVVYNSFTR